MSAPDTGKGVVPEGVWKLNVARSRKLRPAEHTLWIVRDDGHQLAWVSVEVEPDGKIHLSTWDGFYNGDPVEVTGLGMMARIASSEPGRMVTTGHAPGLGDFVEHAELLDGGRRFLCRGEVQTADGLLTYVEDFDWVSPGPMPIA